MSFAYPTSQRVGKEREEVLESLELILWGSSDWGEWVGQTSSLSTLGKWVLGTNKDFPAFK